MRAFVLRVSPGGVDGVPEALASNEISIGWAKAERLMDLSLDYWQFREVVKEAYYPEDPGYRDAGAVAGQLWRFIREMDEGDLVVVPHFGEFYVTKVIGPLIYRREKAEEHSAFRRPVDWLNDAQPIPRSRALAALQSRMKIRQTCADATDLIEEIQDALTVAAGGQERSFEIDLRSRLIGQTRSEITSGHRQLRVRAAACDAAPVARRDRGPDRREVSGQGRRYRRGILPGRYLQLPPCRAGQALPSRTAGRCECRRSVGGGNGGGAGVAGVDRDVRLVLAGGGGAQGPVRGAARLPDRIDRWRSAGRDDRGGRLACRWHGCRRGSGAVADVICPFMSTPRTPSRCRTSADRTATSVSLPRRCSISADAARTGTR